MRVDPRPKPCVQHGPGVPDNGTAVESIAQKQTLGALWQKVRALQLPGNSINHPQISQSTFLSRPLRLEQPQSSQTPDRAPKDQTRGAYFPPEVPPATSKCRRLHPLEYTGTHIGEILAAKKAAEVPLVDKHVLVCDVPVDLERKAIDARALCRPLNSTTASRNSAINWFGRRFTPSADYLNVTFAPSLKPSSATEGMNTKMLSGYDGNYVKNLPRHSTPAGCDQIVEVVCPLRDLSLLLIGDGLGGNRPDIILLQFYCSPTIVFKWDVDLLVLALFNFSSAVHQAAKTDAVESSRLPQS